EEAFDKEITRIYLTFSDPWPKKRHSERRLTSKTFLDKYDKISTT
ncbi:MAG: tRNA (guanosine(46)-N7)-methyltransferase TrmB, partial [Lachnospiraceae bacterium]|nr:tRNA (guanosine(46)-N7)-methyltransferase TrmB [Lachnospiraceae bacterium]